MARERGASPTWLRISLGSRWRSAQDVAKQFIDAPVATCRFASAFNVKRHLRKILNATTERSNVVDGDVELENPTDDADGGMDWGDDADDGELDDDVPELRPRRRPSSVSEEDEDAEKEREDFLCGLVADNETICAEEGPADMISGLPFGGLKANAWETVNPRIRASSEETMLSFGDAKLMFNIMDHALNCSGEQRQNFFGPGQQDGMFPKSKSNNIRIPSDTKTANAMLLEGRHSMFDNLPVENDEHGKPNTDTINGCEAAQEVYADMLEELRAQSIDPRTTAIGLVLLWSDGFQRAYVRQKENSVWILTITILNPDGKAFSAFHTYCVAIGRESLDHTPVIDYVLGQLDVIRRIITTAFGFMVWGSDRIERDSLLKTSQLGTFGQRSHFASAVDPKALPMCNRCFRQLVGSFGQGSRPYFGDSACPDCCRWDYLSPSPAARTNPLPVRYPNKAASDSPSPPEDRTIHETYVVAKRIQFGWLVQGLEYAYHNLTTNDRQARWIKENMTAFLRSMSVNEAVRDQVWASARSKLRNPAAPVIPYIPQLWQSQYRMDRFLNSPMHLLFEGITADVMEVIQKFLKSKSLNAPFERFANVFLSEIESFRLSWCKARELPKTYWQAEDLLGLSRIMPCVYGLFFADANFRGADARVAIGILQMLNAFHAMLSALMGPRCCKDSEKIDIYIKIFLTSIYRVSALIDNDGSFSWLLAKGNFLSLLNLPEQIRRYGPVRWYYEGSDERFVQCVKPFLVTNARKTPSYFKIRLRLMQVMKLIDWIKKSLRLNGAETDRTWFKGYYRYKTLALIRQRMQEGRPLSAFTLSGAADPNGLLWVAYGRAQATHIVAIRPSSTDAVEVAGVSFADCSIVDHSELVHNRRDIEKQMTSYCILFPLKLNNTPFTRSRFATIFSDWDVLQAGRVKGESLPSRGLFSINANQ
ncbi:hypothetical protein ACHAXT_010126 [Thalassiosira profunda]